MLEIKNLSSGYDGVDIIKNISLSIRSGENLFVIGPNGCGKSTLLKTIANIIEMEPIARRLGAETYSPSLTERIKIGIYLANKYKDNENLFLEKLYDIVGAGVNISESVPSAISIAYYAQDPNRCALLCANLAGDTDTIGAMATAICGAFKGLDYIKEEYVESLNKANDIDFASYISILMNGRTCI